MKKMCFWGLLLSITLLTSACTDSALINETSTTPSTSEDAITTAETNAESELPKPLNDYIARVESYMDGAVFRQMEDSETKELSDMLLGHYEIIGRTAGDNMDYYLAIRLSDAPVYDNFKNIATGWISESDIDESIFQIGYYDQNSNEHLLYELDGYTILDFPYESNTLDSFCIGVKETSSASVSSAFQYKIIHNEIMDFIQSKPGLSLYEEGKPCIQFYYQDEETVTFTSAPHSCYLPLDDTETEKLRNLLSASERQDNLKTRGEALKHLSKKGYPIYTTGASLCLDGYTFDLIGDCDSSGYLVSMQTLQGSFSYVYNEELYDFVMDKIQASVNMDYRNFDPGWFHIPLTSAHIDFPESMPMSSDSLRSQTVTDTQKLKKLSTLMDHAINDEENYGFFGCPYNAIITCTREDGETLRLFAATDSCDSISYEGRIGFEYGKQADLVAIFDDAMKYRPEK